MAHRKLLTERHDNNEEEDSDSSSSSSNNDTLEDIEEEEREQELKYVKISKSSKACLFIKRKSCWLSIFLLWIILICGIVAAGVSVSILKKSSLHDNTVVPSPTPTSFVTPSLFPSSFVTPSLFPSSFLTPSLFPSPVPPSDNNNTCHEYCKLSLVETIPENLTYSPYGGFPSHISTYDVWVWLMDNANKTIDIASFYWTLRGDEDSNDPTDILGSNIYNRLIATHQRGIKIRVVQSITTPTYPNKDSAELSKQGVIELRNMDLQKLLGSGILHTKLWIVDESHFYIGSANMDWRSLTQVKELGLFGQNCNCLVHDVNKIYEVYWNISSPDNPSIPHCWPDELTAATNNTHPALLKVNGTMNSVYWTSSPPPISTKYRTDDITGLLDVINKANKFIYIAVMDYYPAIIYDYPKKYWPVIDDAIRTAAYDRGIEIRLMGSCWRSTKLDMITFLNSLGTWNNTGPHGGSINTKLFIVPQLNRTIPYTRVNHNKYMVTDNAAFISTSNWSGDYFVSTGGISCVVNGTTSCPPNDHTSSTDHTSSCTGSIRDQLEEVFERDWNSQYAVDTSLINQVSQCVVD